MTDAKLKSYADRINRTMDELDDGKEVLRDLYLEAKSAGYVPKVLRKAITRQRMEPAKRQEEDSILELYEAALDGPTREAVKLAAQGATSREIEAATGIDHVTVARSVSLKKKHETPTPERRAELLTKIQRLGQEIEEEGGDRQSASRGGEESAASNTASASSPPPVALVLETEEITLKATPACALGGAETPEGIDLTIPAHLRRERII